LKHLMRRADNDETGTNARRRPTTYQLALTPPPSPSSRQPPFQNHPRSPANNSAGRVVVNYPSQLQTTCSGNSRCSSVCRLARIKWNNRGQPETPARRRRRVISLRRLAFFQPMALLWLQIVVDFSEIHECGPLRDPQHSQKCECTLLRNAIGM
jgi:hypothetical protein